jgi:hypothetical protein
MSVFATQFLRKSTSQLLTMCALALAIFSFIFAPSALAADKSRASRANFCKLAGGSRCFRI